MVVAIVDVVTSSSIDEILPKEEGGESEEPREVDEEEPEDDPDEPVVRHRDVGHGALANVVVPGGYIKMYFDEKKQKS